MDGDQTTDAYGPMRPVTEGPWAGWSQWGSDPFEDLAGPFYCREASDGRMLSAFRAESTAPG